MEHERPTTSPDLLAELERQQIARFRDRLPFFGAIGGSVLLIFALVAPSLFIAEGIRGGIPVLVRYGKGYSWAFLGLGVILALGAWMIPALDSQPRSARALARRSTMAFISLAVAGMCVFDAGVLLVDPVDTSIMGFGATVTWIVLLFVAANLILPWRRWTAFGALLVVWTALGALVARYFVVLAEDPQRELDALTAVMNTTFGTLASLCVVAAPGLVICGYRHGRWHQRAEVDFFSGRYTQIRRDLVDARRIHEDLFPNRIRRGAVSLDFAYEPAVELGGDFLFIHRHPDPMAVESDPARIGGSSPLAVVLVDVTGHGVAAALTVNRLHGELERIFGEEPMADPGHVLALLNRYVRVTMAKHSIFPTALAFRVDPRDSRLTYASAGHPPLFLLRRPGGVEQLDSTSVILGAVAPEYFDPSPVEEIFMEGDRVLAYTDGSAEARDPTGRSLRLAGLRRIVEDLVARRCPDFADELISRVAEHRSGPPQDDSLVVVVESREDGTHAGVRRAAAEPAKSV